MRANPFITISAVVVIAISQADSLMGQARNDSLAQRNDCKRVEQILKTHHPTADLMWAVNHISLCGGNGAVFAGGFVRSLDQDQSDSVITSALFLSAQVRAREIFEAGLSLAASGVSSKSRLLGLLIATRQVSPSLALTMQSLETARPGRRCALGHDSGPGPRELSPMPADAATRLQATAAELHDFGAVEAVVRDAGDCIEYEMRLFQVADSTD